jgi:hypothetical protein
MRRPLSLLLRGLAAFALLAPVSVITTMPVSAAPLSAAGACNTGIGNAGGQGIICEVTIVNTVTTTGGSAVVTVHECLGSAGDPTDGALGHACTTTTTTLDAPVTAITQCNGSANGGGATLRCSVTVTNNFVDMSPGASPVTVNQCVGSGEGTTTGCNPFPATTTGAAITQCNGSANGGTLVQLTCTATGTQASALIVTVDQCNGSALGGGALAICSASMVNVAAAPSPTALATGTAAASPTALATGTAAADQSLPPTSTSDSGSSSSSMPLIPILLALGGFAAAVVVTERRSIRS